ncbi:carboxyl-terminal processing protease [Tistlia consotensis]|uniref:Carboxyl-terminal processing protease n=1 Tax=Tistlia consotensis USBA 355 TaxID=560819 RepID=A0A1Y6BTK1_9PROT|nr:S41 family peptidase [Tistlia consotensis]SMF20754.1 carboxyl-terminal processing protease [Tistlia consotensis USBA 355]SNR47591.1 carboxyl-terminal processing protease [Tistlia consotensis]
MTASGRSRFPRPALSRLGALTLTLLILGSCAAAPQQQAAGESQFDEGQVRRMFSAGYQDISSVYIREIPVEDLAMHALRGLSDIDPSIAVTQDGKTFVMTVGGLRAGQYDMPEGDSSGPWARATAEAVADTRKLSKPLADTPIESVYETMFDAMLTQLDTYSRYAGRDEARENRASRDGFGGIGVRIRVVEEGVRVMDVMEGTPAEAAGLKNDDLIVSIDGESAVGLDQRDVVRRLRGPLDSKVEMTVRREGVGQPIKLDITRAHIVPQTVSYHPEGREAYFKVTGFNQNTTRSLRDKILEAQHEMGGNLAGYILDLRGNPGGLLDQSVTVADLFIGHGRIVSTHGRHPDSHQYFDAQDDVITGGRPVVALVNGNSASASEIVAAALQDSGQAVIVGSNSFGKGTVQTVLRMPNEGELTLTWARFHAPSGYALQHRGVLPDICTSTDVGGADEVVDRLVAGQLPIARAVRQADIQPDDETALAALRARCPTRETESEIDVKVARRLIEDPGLYARARGDAPTNTADRGHAVAAAVVK